MDKFFKKYSELSIENSLSGLSAKKDGLSEEEVSNRLKQYGPNKLSTKKTGWWLILIEQFKSSFNYLLIIAAVIALAAKEHIDGVLIFAAVLINVLLGFYQEFKSQKTASLLKQYLTSFIKVIRNGEEIFINIENLVPGDIIAIETGNVIPADIRFIEINNLLIDESVLTGESIPIKKTIDPLENISELYQATNTGFTGTTVVSGRGLGVVFATGKESTFSLIAKLLTKKPPKSSLSKEISKFGNFVLKFVAISLTLIAVLNLVIKGSQINFIDMVTLYIALAVSVIPETLPTIITYSLSKGALILSKKKVIVKRLPTISGLGSIQVLCTDKTGTLTENELTVTTSYLHESSLPLEIYAGLSCRLKKDNKNIKLENPFDNAILNFITQDKKDILQNHKRLFSLPFTPQRRSSSIIVEYENKTELITRGAAEFIIKNSSNIGEKESSDINDWIKEQEKQGFRLIAFAKKEIQPESDLEKVDETNLDFIGLIAFSDPIKKSTFQAMKSIQKLALKLKILTGDSKEIANYIGQQLNIIHPDSNEIMSGEEFSKLSESEREVAVEKVHIFSRISPEQKFEIVQLLQKKYEVGFLGDGINDAPALNIADVGIAVQNSNDISREAADIILLKKDLKAIIDGIKEGRKIFRNITKYLQTTLSSNFGNFFAIGTSSLLIPFSPLLAKQILLINFLSDIPLIFIATDNIEASTLKKPSTYSVQKIGAVAVILGIVSTTFDFIFFILFKTNAETLQSAWFIGSILTEIAFIFSIRAPSFFLKSKPSLALLIASFVVAVCTLAIPYTSIGQYAFEFASPSKTNIILIIAIVITYLFATDVIKCLVYKLRNNKTELPSN
ncbi:HAD-IC family P-type ATPase [Candidatus Babeliales bacterium]|nr:HAD-IC family P-type ATPase [Candidatus Babeliales bacterium]